MIRSLKRFLLWAWAIVLIVSCSENTNNPPTTDPADQAAFDAANGVNGAQLYDHPLNYINADQTKYPNNRTDFYRCKSCHGWDLKGQNGVLINKPSSESYPIAALKNLYEWTRSHTIKEVFDAVKNTGGRIAGTYDETHPDYGKILTDAQIWNIVKFLKVAAHNVSDFYDMTTTGSYPTGTRTFSNIGKGGDAAAGLATYQSKCQDCHGTDGRKIDIYCKGLFLGEMFREDPHEVQHKAIWGMPLDRENKDKGCTFANSMPSINITDQDIRNMMVMGQDAVMFP